MDFLSISMNQSHSLANGFARERDWSFFCRTVHSNTHSVWVLMICGFSVDESKQLTSLQFNFVQQFIVQRASVVNYIVTHSNPP